MLAFGHPVLHGIQVTKPCTCRYSDKSPDKHSNHFSSFIMGVAIAKCKGLVAYAILHRMDMVLIEFTHGFYMWRKDCLVTISLAS